MKNILFEKLKAGEPTIGTRAVLNNPLVMEIAGATGQYDYVEFLAEYGPFSQVDTENMARAAEGYGMGTLIKVDFANRVYVAQKAVAAGFQAVLFTDHRTADQVAESIDAVRADCGAAGGKLGYSLRRFSQTPLQATVTEHIKRSHEIVCAFMIEKKEAVENIDEICSVPGVAMVQFGGYDYCMSNGWDPRDHAEDIKAAEEKVIAAALKHGVRPRAEIYTAEQADYYKALGVKDFNIGIDSFILRDYWTAEGKALRARI